jgi:hypothetical protein
MGIGSAESVERPLGSEWMGAWRLVRTRNPRGADAVSIMHTADVSRSDLDFAGLMIRCGNSAPEVVIVLVRPFPMRAGAQVVFGDQGRETRFEATVVPPGTAVLLPMGATVLASGAWQGLTDLFVRVDSGQTTIRGVVTLVGLRSAFRTLLANCPAQ